MEAAQAVLQRFREIEDMLPLPQELMSAHDSLKRAEDALPAQAGHNGDCDRWCRVWMLLFGASYSLRCAHLYCDDNPLLPRLRFGHSFGRANLDSRLIGDLDVTGWYAGYFLVSAEYRIAGSFDRTTKLFVQDNPAEDLNIYNRCEWFLKYCPNCKSVDYLVDAAVELEKFLQKKGSLSEVWRRVNALKHGSDTPVSDKTSLQRFREAADALGIVALVLWRLSEHKAKCGQQIRAG